jgi:GAF domain-containing protein
VTAWKGPRAVPVAAELALAFLAGLTSFAVVAVTIGPADSDVLVALLGVAYLGAVIAIAHFVGVAYAVPAAMAGLLAYDWYYLPPTHPLEFPDSANLVDLLVFLGVAALIGEVAASEGRRADISELARGELAEEQAALRRVATLVAQDVAPGKLFGAATAEVGRLLGADFAGMIRYESDHTVPMAAWAAVGDHPDLPDRWPMVEGDPATMIAETGRPARIDDWSDVPGPIAALARDKMGLVSSVGSPIIVGGRLWGALAVHSKQTEPLPADTEARLENFTDLVATAMSNAHARADVRKLADEQAALRRVATLVARDVPPPEVFAAVAREMGLLLEVDLTHIGRYEPDDAVVGVSGWSRTGDHVPVGTRTHLDSDTVTGLVFDTGRPARMNAYDTVEGGVAHVLRDDLGVRSSVGAPIIVEGRLWGVAIASTRSNELLPSDTESRIAGFTEIVATAISTTEARGEVGRLADEQAALRRVATLVARRVPRVEVFETVTREIGFLSGADLARMERYEPDGSVTGVAGWSRDPEEGLAVGSRFELEGVSIAALVLERGAPARVDSFAHASGPIAEEALRLGIRSSVGCPISVEGRIWGVIAASSRSEGVFPADTESQIGEFTELVATAISNAEARAELSQLAEEQAALRRVATLVAREAPSDEIFPTVAEEVGRFVGVEAATLLRYEADATATALASWGDRDAPILVGTRMSLDGENVTALVLRTGRPARIDDYTSASGSLGTHIRDLGYRSAVGSPILVRGQIWGALVVGSRKAEPLPAGIESRIAQFTDLIATAISNIQARSDLAASRARIITTTDETRRRFERDLHDGIQQRLVSLALELKGAEAISPPAPGELRAQLRLVSEGLTGLLDDVRELSRGIHPAILSEGGLGPALRALGRRSAVPVRLKVNVDGRVDERVEVAAYYVVSEALANAAKHARASTAEIRIEARNGILDLTIQDDGIGGADPARGSGLTGLMDRVEALGGTLAIESPSGEGTSLRVQLPVAGR